MDNVFLSPETADWLHEKRGIPHDVSARCGCVTMNGKLAFEYRKDGRLQYRKVRMAGPDGKSFARDRSGAETCLFLEHALQTDPDLSSPLVICEGEIDALSLVAANVPNVVSVPDGAQLDELGKGKIVPEDDKAFGWLWEQDKGLKPHLAQFERIIIATDSDKKGRILREELAVRFERWRCDYVTYPDGCKDANDVLVRFGPAALARCIEDAKPIVPSRLVSFGEIPDRGTGELYGSGFKGLDDGLKFSMITPELMVITGEPGSGKSEFAAILGANLANYSELPGAILQFEDRTIRVRDTLTRYAVSNVQGCETAADGRAWVNKWFRTIEPEQNISDDVDYDIAWLTTTLREARVRHGCRWVVIDPWNELEHIWDRSQNEAAYTNEALRKLKRISRALQIVLIIVAHPSKEGGRQKDITEMDLYGISGSAAWANKADHGIIVHRPDKAKQDVYVKVAKSKDHMLMGTPGIVRMKYLPASAQYKYIGMGV